MAYMEYRYQLIIMTIPANHREDMHDQYKQAQYMLHEIYAHTLIYPTTRQKIRVWIQNVFLSNPG